MNLRRIAARILSHVIHGGQSLTAALEQQLPESISAQDKALLQAICYGVVRHYFELHQHLGQLLSKPLKAKDSDIECLILVGLYQLQYMRIKAHAAVAETVAACKHKPWAKSLVNAVLRQFQRDDATIRRISQQNPIAQYNHPQWMLDQLEQHWPEQAETILTANNHPAPMTLRINPLQTNREHYGQQLLAQGLEYENCTFSRYGIRLHHAVNVDTLPGFASGQVSVQDEAAQLAAQLLDAQPHDRVLDLCAAPGGKTAAILESQPQLQALLAVDVDAKRLQRVQDTLHRLQLQAETKVADATEAASWAGDRGFERILLDAPCSGLGVIRRHPDIKLLRREADIAQLQDLQSRILDAAWSLLNRGGILVYATCSILKQENEQQIAAFLSRHPDAQEVPITADWGIARPQGRQILTGQQQMDGFYYAKLRKTAD